MYLDPAIEQKKLYLSGHRREDVGDAFVQPALLYLSFVTLRIYIFLKKRILFKKLDFKKVNFQKNFPSNDNASIWISHPYHQKFLNLTPLYVLHPVPS